jgi:hypothetical protein
MQVEKMKAEKGTVRAPEIGRLWLNSPPPDVIQGVIP